MCARFGVTTNVAAFARLLGASTNHELRTSYNLPPGSDVSAVVREPRSGEIRFDHLFWGFIPSWDTRGRPLNNARLEKRDGRYWRKAFARRRCVLPADWWYEWQSRQGKRQPHALRPASGEPFFLAGVWAVPKSLAEDHRAAHRRCVAVVTQPANAQLSLVHHRMPVALNAAGARAWLEADDANEQLGAIAEQHGFDDYESWPISTAVNRPDPADGPALLEPIAPAGQHAGG